MPPFEIMDMRQFQARILDAETRHSPREFMKFISTVRSNPDLSKLAAGNETRQALAKRWRLEPYKHEDISADVTLFRGRRSAKGRRLLVAMTALLGRMTVSTPAFLQCLPARKWDVLILRDSAKTHYRRGCVGYADNFPDLTEQVQRLAAAYAGCCVIGTSMGGFPAIRMALRIQGARGVSLGGRPVVDVVRLFHDRFAGMAFDPLCDCLPKMERDLIFVHGAENRSDLKAARQFAKIAGGRTCGLPGIAAHGFIADIWRKGRLSQFLETVTDPKSRGRKLIISLAAVVT
jgi:hypothetical protein